VNTECAASGNEKCRKSGGTRCRVQQAEITHFISEIQLVHAILAFTSAIN
jgi:hypothetical protein